MNCRRETVEKGVPPGNRRELDSVLEQYVAGSDAEDAQKDAHIRGRSRRLMKHPG
jgi:hypothetical protein